MLSLTAIAQAGQIQGYMDGVYGPSGGQQIGGWACELGNANSIYVDVYTGGPPGVGQLYGRFYANAASEDAIGAICGNSTAHRYNIPVSGALFDRAGQSIHVYGITQNGGDNSELTNSGTSAVPQMTVSSTLDTSDSNGFFGGWAFDYLNPSSSIGIRIYADGLAGQGAETGTLVWSGSTTVSRPDVNAAYGIGGVHGFSATLPAWTYQGGVHRISVYAVSVNGALEPVAGSPRVPGASTVTNAFSIENDNGWVTDWHTTSIGANGNILGLKGTVSVENIGGHFVEYLFLVGFFPGPSCPAQGTEWPEDPTLQGTTLWSAIIKAPTGGTYSSPVDFTLPAPVPTAAGCIYFAINGGPLGSGNQTHASVDLSLAYNNVLGATATAVSAAGEFCFGQTTGCQGATTNSYNSFAHVTTITTRGLLVALWGNANTSTFDGLELGYGAPPAGPWTGMTDVYLYRANTCGQFPTGVSSNGPADYYHQIPYTAISLASVRESGNAGINTNETINFLMPGFTTGTTVGTSLNVQMEVGDCLVTLFGMSGSYGGFDNETQITAIVVPN